MSKDEIPVDSLDAYMASLEVPSNAQSLSMVQARAECKITHPAARGDLAVVVKNRRYRHLQQMLEDSSEDRYFSDAMMQQRSPALFHFYLGQYMGLEKNAVPSLASTDQLLSSFLLDTLQRREMEARRVAEQEKWGEFIAADEEQKQIQLRRWFETNDVEEEEEDEEKEKEKEEEEKDEKEDATVYTIDEQRQQLIEIMSARFLNGEDSEFINYADIDNSENLDDFVEMQRDAEDRYFLLADGADTVS